MNKFFSLEKAQKKGSMSTEHTVDWIVGALIAVLLVAVLGPTIFSYLGNTSTGLGNTTANPSVPTWLSPVLIILVGVGFLYLVMKGIGIGKTK